MKNKKKQKILNEKFSRGPYDKATIERATKYYIRPKCSNIDPGQERELRHALMATREDLFGKVDYFVNQDENYRHLLVLADSGTGKTSFLLNYYAYNARKPKSKKHKIALVPLSVKNADELIAQIPCQDETILFLDALDEDKKAIIDHQERISLLMDQCYKFKKIIITCRTQFFPKGEEIPTETGVLKLGPRKAGEKGIYEFWKLYLAPFDDEEVKKYIRKRYPFWMSDRRQKALKLAQKIPMLVVRPMLLAHIPDIIDSKANVATTYQIYETMVDAWCEREIEWVDKQALRKFSENLAVDLYINEQNREHDGVKYYELTQLARGWKIDLQDWQLGGRSLLNIDAEDYFKFSHRSVLEYFFMKKMLYDGLSLYGIRLTDQMILFLTEIYSNVPELGRLLSLIDKSLVFNFTHDLDGSVVRSLPKINWWVILKNKIDNFGSLFEEPGGKYSFLGTLSPTISLTLPTLKSFQVSLEKSDDELLKKIIDSIILIEELNKSGIITIFPNKDFTVLEIIMQKI